MLSIMSLHKLQNLLLGSMAQLLQMGCDVKYHPMYCSFNVCSLTRIVSRYVVSFLCVVLCMCLHNACGSK